MAKSRIRVFELAREIGVRSKDVLEKCRAEGLDVKNHMSSLSAGLEETIRDWFSEYEDGNEHTAVETAEHVDLEKAREEAKKTRRKKKKAEEPAAEEAAAEEEETPSEEADAGEAAAEAVTVAETEEGVADEAATGVAEEPVAETAAAPVTEAEEAVAAVEEPAPEGEPAPEEGKLRPAGPQVVPKPAKLEGPRVVRVEEPEYVARPRPRARPRPSKRPPAMPPPQVIKKSAEDEEKDRKTARKGRSRSPRRKGGADDREIQRRIKEWKEQDLQERADRIAGAGTGYYRRRVSRGQSGAKGFGLSGAGIKKGKVDIDEPITVKKLSEKTGIKVSEIIKKLMQAGTMASVNHVIDTDQAQNVVMDHEIELVVAKSFTDKEKLLEKLGKREKGEEVPRATVVTFLGHVDHGKTSLMDYIRDSRVAEGEAGGITQAMGSYRYDMEDRHVTFLDTPGHEAFTAMRSRGANITDVVTLVVAADDGVMPQTVEAINHAKAADVPIVVALNKIDLPNADINKALGQLAEYGLQPQEWGGNTEVIKTSAKTGEGIEDLLDVLTLEADILELKAEVDAPASGYVIEAFRDPSKGVLAKVLNMNGTLKSGDVVLAGTGYGFVRSIYDDWGKVIEEAGPAVPVTITGLNEIPEAGDEYYVVESIDRARTVAQETKERQRKQTLAAASSAPTSLEELFGKLDEQDSEEVALVLKADAQGSLEALKGALEKLSHEEVAVKIIHAGVGGETLSDVNLADVSNALVIGFNVSADQEARKLAEEKGVEILNYNVIYDIVKDVRNLVIEGLAPEIKVETLGQAEVRQTFKISRLGTIAGCYVTDGTINRNARIKVIRDGVVLDDNRTLDSLKRVKDDVREVKSGLECGLKIADFNDIKEGDIIECYQTVEVARTV